MKRATKSLIIWLAAHFPYVFWRVRRQLTALVRFLNLASG